VAITAMGFADGSTRVDATAVNELVNLSAVEAVAAMRRGDIAAETYAQTLLARAGNAKR
jgi:hypothetical protein